MNTIMYLELEVFNQTDGTTKTLGTSDQSKKPLKPSEYDNTAVSDWRQAVANKKLIIPEDIRMSYMKSLASKTIGIDYSLNINLDDTLTDIINAIALD